MLSMASSNDCHPPSLQLRCRPQARLRTRQGNRGQKLRPVRIVLWQACVTSACGAAAGIAGAAALAPALPYIVPELTVSFTPHVLTLVALAAVAIAGTGALMPLRRLADVDPEEVFRS